MFATEFRDTPARPSARRVAAWSGAFALHVVAFGVLVAPIATPLVERVREEPPIWVVFKPLEPEVVPVVPRIERPVVPRPAVEPRRARVDPLPVTVDRPVLESADFAEPVVAEPVLPEATLEPVAGEPALARVALATADAPPPSYPIIALRRGQEGTVLLRVEVATDGRPRTVAVERSSGHRALDDAARRQVLTKWRFVPAMRNGRAIEAVGLVPVRFSLDRG